MSASATPEVVTGALQKTIELPDLRKLPPVDFDQMLALTVKDADSAALMSVNVSVAADFRRTVESLIAGPKAEAHRLHKSITAIEAKYIALPLRVETYGKSELKKWDQEEQRARLAQAAALNQAREAEAKANWEAEQMPWDLLDDNQPGPPPPPEIVLAPAPKIEGVNIIPKAWDFEVEDLRVFVQALLDKGDDAELKRFIIVGPEMKAEARRLGEQLSTVYPGIKPVRDSYVRVKR